VSKTQPCYVVEAAYVSGAADKRQPFREQHLERMGKLQAEGALALAGAFDDMSGSLLVFNLETEAAVKAIVESDIYWRNKIWTGYTIKKLNRVDFAD